VTESGYESAVDRQIREAQERGDFDDLPGMGKPLPGWGTTDDEMWWLRQWSQRERLGGGMLPTSLQLARELEVLPDKVRRLPSEQAVRDVVDSLNRRIADYLRAPSGHYVPLRPADADEIVRGWREGRPAGPGATA
jgi:hypothetical protein